MAGPRRELTAQEVRELLTELGRRLQERVRAEAEQLAAERGPPRAWLNNSVAGFVPGGDDGAVLLDIPGVAVAASSPEHLLAMTMVSYRPGKDQADLELLFERLRVSAPEQAADIALGVYGEYTVVLPDREELILSAQAILDRRRRGSGHRPRLSASQGRKPAGRPGGGQDDAGARTAPGTDLG